MYCTRKLNHISITNGYGIVKPCCIFNDDLCNTTLDNNLLFNNSFNEIVQSPFRQKILNHFDGCEKCIESENIRNDSLRLRSNSLNKNPINDVEELEIALDFNCNMRCFSCRPGVSSRWNINDDVIDKLLLLDNQHYKNLNIKNYDKYILKLIKQTDFSKLKSVRIVGGEPFLAKNLEYFLNNIPPVDLSFNTNGSILPKFSTLQRHKSIKIDVSLDAIGELSEVIRYGSDFKQISKNIDIMKDKFDVEVCCTISILNINMIGDLYEYTVKKGIKINFILLYDPKFLSIFQLSVDERKKWNIGYSIFDDFLRYNYTIDRKLKKAKQFIDIMDSLNKTCYKQVNPEIYELLC